MLYWNVVKWQSAVDKLRESDSRPADESYDTYGCNLNKEPCIHYSGNFWWSGVKHINTLPRTIGPGYCDPEFWILTTQDRNYCAHNSNIDHYYYPYPAKNYECL